MADTDKQPGKQQGIQEGQQDRALRFRDFSARDGKPLRQGNQLVIPRQCPWANAQSQHHDQANAQPPARAAPPELPWLTSASDLSQAGWS